MDGDSPAAMLYGIPPGQDFQCPVGDIDKETVPWCSTDDTAYEPTVLPARFPNLLVNG